jgi:hypothetical protein
MIVVGIAVGIITTTRKLWSSRSAVAITTTVGKQNGEFKTLASGVFS